MNRSGWLGLAGLLSATFAGSYYSNIALVPLGSILSHFGAGVGAGTLVLSGFAVTMAAATPLASWLGERVGWTRSLVVAVIAMGAGSAGAALSPDLAVLVLFRVLQGLVAALVLPAVMMVIATTLSGRDRLLAVGMWSSANSLARVVAVPAGGVLARFAGWSSVFWSAVPVCGLAVAWLVLFAPRVGGNGVGGRGVGGRGVPADRKGAAMVTIGSLLFLGGLAALPDGGAGLPLGASMAVLGAAVLWRSWRWAAKASNPFIRQELIRSGGFLRSSIGSFVQMLCIMVDVAGVSLYLVHGEGMNVAAAGTVVLALPLMMAVASPVAGWMAGLVGGRRVFWIGLAILAWGEAALWLATGTRSPAIPGLVAGLGVAGAGAAIVQTATAGGATREEGGSDSTAVGVFNLIRFAGSAVGAAWLAVAFSLGGTGSIAFLSCAAAVIAAFGVTRFLIHTPDGAKPS